ncbi:TniQ family protein [Streptomyces kaniharaensis]|uniref:TniQ family protein n=1 Tax=Streptomyces kaniharaensis TaxID=212423 RepID=A0A6N7KST6_9ACTN|nr:TniQ family protein [Streptomyces kaniharaensis]MQS14702.1 TniQ family protein [Streptomyces kaniharaensis]MQS17118.1 TniQ family protein [Streptomyces kaniharaensis]
MKEWTDQRIPIWVPPLPGEALDSWLEAYARRLRVTTHVFMAFVGLRGSRPSRMTERLSGSEREILSQVTGLSPQELAAMTLEPYEGLTVTFKSGQDGMNRPPTWRYYGTHSRFCPACLDDTRGRWLLAWRQPWSFACLRHRRLLLERCPACEQFVRAQGTRVGGPSKPAHCTRGRHRTEGCRRVLVACGFSLAQSPAQILPASGLVLQAQQHVDALLQDRFSQPGSARTQLHDMYSLGWRSLAGLATDLGSAPRVVHQVLEETGGAMPIQTHAQDATDVRSIAIGTALARLADPRPTPADPKLFEWILKTSDQLSTAQDGSSPSSRATAWRRASPHLSGYALARLDADLTLIARVRYGTAAPRPYWRSLTQDQIRRRAASLPDKLWPSWTMRLLTPALANGRSADRFRRAASTLLMLPGTRLDYGPATALLDHKPNAKARRMLDSYPQDVLASVIAQLAWAIDEQGAPIDYARRRRLFREDTIRLDLPALNTISTKLGWDSEPARTRLIRWHLLDLLLGSSPESVQDKITTHHRFRLHMPRPLKDFLHDQAEANLERFGIDEPVRWEPPDDWATVDTWPGFDSDNIDHGLASHLAAAGFSEALLVRELGLTTTHFRLYCESLGITITPSPKPARRPTGRTRGKGVPRVGPLAPDQLHDRYIKQKMTTAQIGRLAGCSGSTVSQALREAGISTPQRRPNGVFERTIDRDWLETEYRIKGRSAPDIARELGLHKNPVIKLIKKYEIPRNTPGLHSNPFAPLDIQLSPTMAAVNRTPNCVQRLRHLIQLPGQPHVAAAAKALGLRDSVLRYQINAIEKTTGFPVITWRTSPLAATAPGRELLAEAELLLLLLDRHSSQTVTGEPQPGRRSAH